MTPENRRAGPVVTAYVILSHGEPQPVARLARLLRALSPNCHVFVNHDARNCAPPEIDDPAVHVRAHGRATDWGSFEIVLAELDAFAWAREVADPDLVVLISGQDYPTGPLVDWERSAVEAGGWAGYARALSYRPRWGLGDEAGFSSSLLWYSYRWYPLPVPARIPDAARTASYRVLHGLFKRTEPLVAYRFLRRGKGPHLGVPRRPSPFSAERPCFKGSQWLALDRRLLDYVLARAVPEDPLFEVFSRSLIPDEAYLQTLLSWESPARGPAISYLDWCWTPRAESPKTLTLADLPAIIDSGSPFCRKVDPEVSGALLDELDRRCR